jgi:DNA-binding response OmpR family regulator
MADGLTLAQLSRPPGVATARQAFSSREKEPSLNKKILIVEDQLETRAMLALTLRYKDYEPLEAEDGYAGIEKSVAEHPDLVLLDLSLPGISGLDTARKIKENPQTGNIPIIAFTAWDPRMFEAKAREAGIVAYLQKPVSLGEIVERIEMFTQPNASSLPKPS